MIYEHPRSRGEHVFEERITLFQAPDAEAAGALALAESEQYLAVNPSFKRSTEIAAYSIGDHVSSLDGAEVWSHLFVASDDLEKFVRKRYKEPVRDV